jgi:tellurite resistance protein TehA-like permease
MPDPVGAAVAALSAAGSPAAPAFVVGLLFFISGRASGLASLPCVLERQGAR